MFRIEIQILNFFAKLKISSFLHFTANIELELDRSIIALKFITFIILHVFLIISY